MLDGGLQIRVGHGTAVGGGGGGYPLDGVFQLLVLVVQRAYGVNLPLAKGTLGQAATLSAMLLRAALAVLLDPFSGPCCISNYRQVNFGVLVCFLSHCGKTLESDVHFLS
jgi:hypothetical protein